MNVRSRMSRALAVSAALFGSQVFAEEKTTDSAPSAPRINLQNVTHDNRGLPLQTFGSMTLPGQDLPINTPTLGEPELIGHLTTFSLLDVEVQRINLEEPFLGPPILLASLEEEITDVATAIPASDPEQIQHHLQQSIRLLADAGLAEQAQGIRSVLDEFRSIHRDRLALNKKRAELAALQAEIAQLSQQLDFNRESGQVTIDLKICEIDKDALGNTPQSLTVEEFKKLHEGWAAKKAITPLSQPQIRAMNGQQAEIYVGTQQVPAPEVNVRPGVSVSLVPTILDNHRVRASITSERTELTGSAQQSLVSRSKVQAESELTLNRVVWFSLGETAADSNKVAIVWAALKDVGPLKTANGVDQQGRGVTPAGYSAPR